jgi:hypothetical protein
MTRSHSHFAVRCQIVIEMFHDSSTNICAVMWSKIIYYQPATYMLIGFLTLALNIEHIKNGKCKGQQSMENQPTECRWWQWSSFRDVMDEWKKQKRWGSLPVNEYDYSTVRYMNNEWIKRTESEMFNGESLLVTLCGRMLLSISQDYCPSLILLNSAK